ncbi:hypothetical protein WwAna1667 [Wolbachia endosymbiont of Drosophila ananassae]|nr:hypothetical protein WwAna1667 [Wolbachia endosymbiont of Drosophila ananassae]
MFNSILLGNDVKGGQITNLEVISLLLLLSLPIKSTNEERIPFIFQFATIKKDINFTYMGESAGCRT